MKIAFYTLGCKVNQFDTAGMEETVRGAEHTVVSWENKADVYVINSCTVTEKSNREAARMVRKFKRDRPGAKVVVTGCYAQTHPEELGRMPGVDVVLGNSRKFSLPDILAGCEKAPEEGADSFGEFPRGPLDQPLIRAISGHTRVFLKIQDGCDFRCSFCLIPKARGPGRSLSANRVIEQVRILEENGVREVVLTGVNLGTYGRDFTPKASLAGLLVRLLRETAIPRIRLSSLEPKTLTPGLLKVIAESPRICRHFHIPLQSGDDGILEGMDRHYTREYYRRRILDLAARFPRAGFGTDVMVGFPGEDEAAFDRTESLLRELPMSYFHVFPYSPRPTTPAIGRKGEVPSTVKEERAQRLRDVSAEKRNAHQDSLLGEVLPVLVMAERDPLTGLWEGLADNYAKVYIEEDSTLSNRIIPVRIGRAAGGILRGRPE